MRSYFIAMPYATSSMGQSMGYLVCKFTPSLSLMMT